MKTVIEMAREAGFTNPVRADGYMGLAYDRREGGETGGSLERFAELVRLDEREMCAYKAGIAVLGADRGLANRVDQAIRSRSNT